jgi:hypothetical protein
VVVDEATGANVYVVGSGWGDGRNRPGRRFGLNPPRLASRCGR